MIAEIFLCLIFLGLLAVTGREIAAKRHRLNAAGLATAAGLYACVVWGPWLLLALLPDERPKTALIAFPLLSVLLPASLYLGKRMRPDEKGLAALSETLNALMWHVPAVLFYFILVPKTMDFAHFDRQMRNFHKLQTLRDAVETYKDLHGALPEDLAFLESVPRLRIYTNAYVDHRHQSREIVVVHGEELPDLGSWCYNPDSGRVSICCSGPNPKSAMPWNSF